PYDREGDLHGKFSVGQIAGRQRGDRSDAWRDGWRRRGWIRLRDAYARHQRRVQDPQVAQRAIDDDPAFDEQAAQGHRVVGRATRDRYRSFQSQVRLPPVSRLDRQSIARGARYIDRDQFGIGAVVGNAHDGVAAPSRLPFGKSVGDRVVPAWPDRDELHVGGEIAAHQPRSAAI